jgi:hypothetical protein
VANHAVWQFRRRPGVARLSFRPECFNHPRKLRPTKSALRSDPGDNHSCSVSPTFLELRAGEVKGPADDQPLLISQEVYKSMGGSGDGW